MCCESNLHEYPTPGEANPPRRSDLVVGGMAGEPEKGCRESGKAWKPQRDLTLGGLDGVRSVHEVLLTVEGKITANGSRNRLLDRVGASTDLAERSNSSRSFQHCGDDGSRGDELE